MTLTSGTRNGDGIRVMDVSVKNDCPCSVNTNDDDTTRGHDITRVVIYFHRRTREISGVQVNSLQGSTFIYESTEKISIGRTVIFHGLEPWKLGP